MAGFKRKPGPETGINTKIDSGTSALIGHQSPGGGVITNYLMGPIRRMSGGYVAKKTRRGRTQKQLQSTINATVEYLVKNNQEFANMLKHIQKRYEEAESIIKKNRNNKEFIDRNNKDPENTMVDQIIKILDRNQRVNHKVPIEPSNHASKSRLYPMEFKNSIGRWETVYIAAHIFIAYDFDDYFYPTTKTTEVSRFDLASIIFHEITHVRFNSGHTIKDIKTSQMTTHGGSYGQAASEIITKQEQDVIHHTNTHFRKKYGLPFRTLTTHKGYYYKQVTTWIGNWGGYNAIKNRFDPYENGDIKYIIRDHSCSLF